MTRQRPPHLDSNPEGSPPQGASTLLGIYDRLRDAGYRAQLIAQDDAAIKCAACRTSTAVAEWTVDGYRRTEGASDPADQNLVVWATCPCCFERGVLTLGYGPNTSIADVAVLDALSLDSTDTSPLPGE